MHQPIIVKGKSACCFLTVLDVVRQNNAPSFKEFINSWTLSLQQILHLKSRTAEDQKLSPNWEDCYVMNIIKFLIIVKN